MFDIIHESFLGTCGTNWSPDLELDIAELGERVSYAIDSESIGLTAILDLQAAHHFGDFTHELKEF